jgi:hypothetical protein
VPYLLSLSRNSTYYVYHSLGTREREKLKVVSLVGKEMVREEARD